MSAVFFLNNKDIATNVPAKTATEAYIGI